MLVAMFRLMVTVFIASLFCFGELFLPYTTGSLNNHELNFDTSVRAQSI